jgi:DNA invertase Pin-like site-specific DNA recombinase
MVAEFEADLIRARTRTREGMQVAKAKGRLRGKQPKLSKSQEALVVSLYNGGQHTTAEIADIFKIARSTVYRIVKRTPTTEESVGALPANEAVHLKGRANT